MGRPIRIIVFMLLLTILSPSASSHLIDLFAPPIASPENKLVFEFQFPNPILTSEAGFSSIEISGLPRYGAPGEPVLPFKTVNILIPQGEKASLVEATGSIRKTLEGKHTLAFGKTPLPTSSNLTFDDKPDMRIYGSANPFPASLFSQMAEQYLNGFRILPLRLYPAQYVPKTGEISYFESITVAIHLEATTEASHLSRNTPEDLSQINGLVANPDSVETYTKTTPDISPKALGSSLSSYDYVIITSSALNTSFQTLIDWKIQKGLNACTVLIEDILKDPKYNSDGPFGDGNGSPKFNDTQARIRNFIRDAYQNWGTKYVLLGADDEIIPARGVYCSGGYYINYTDYNIPCDMYYGCLDGSWDKDNDTVFAEAVYPFPGPENATAGEEADFFAEVYIGRTPVDTAQEAANFVAKTIAYEQNSQADYLKKALMIGETLDALTQGANSMDLLTDIIPQYSTTRLYTRDGTYTAQAVINNMNNGAHIVNHDGHSNYATVMGLTRSLVDNLNNTQYFMVYSLGCYSAAFDQATSGTGEAIAEHFIYTPHGAFAYIGNTRYGWYVQGSTDGPGDRYDRSFFSILNNGTTNLGKALQLSKEQEPILDRWIYFTLNLLGDPETPIITQVKAPTAHLETKTDQITRRRIAGTFNVKGTAKRGNASNSTFSNFTITYGQGINPSLWSTSGLNLSYDGQNEITAATLATWNTTQVSAGTYTLGLSVCDLNGTLGEDRQVVVIDQSANPIYIKNDGSIYPSNAPIQRNGDLYTLTSDINGSGDGIIIERNNIRLNGAGHVLQGADAYGIGISLSSRNNVTIENVTVKDYLYGIYLNHSTQSTAIYCSVDNNTHGIFLLSSSNNNISQNNATRNYDGISLMSFSNDNSIIGNNITQNYGTMTGGLCLFSSSNNIIHHNTFTNNYLNVYDAAWDCADSGLTSASINFWDNGYPSGGNYWSDYNGTDTNSGPYQNETGSDGIGDTPYTIDMNNRDNYPLLLPRIPGDVNGDFKVNILDSIIVGNSFLTTPLNSNWNPNADLNNDSVVNILDSIIIGNHFLEHYP